jgi:ferredoxin-NADP reductase
VGITPILPMLSELLARPGEIGSVSLFWGNREAEDLFWLKELGALADRHARLSLHLSLSRGAPSEPCGRLLGRPIGQGRIGAPLLDALPRLTQPTFYLVGNGAMISEVKTALVAAGVNRKRQIRTEAFFD